MVIDSSRVFPQLPITEVLGQIQQTLCEHQQAVIEAPPGAGKTTLVPLALLDQIGSNGQRIIMLEPRRMAARSCALRMASLLGESIGQTVGYRIRQETRIGPDTRIEVITEGILTRMLLEDPSLEGIGLVIFDEFHERSLDADFALALTLQGRALFRDQHNPLRVIVMSATLDGARIAKLLDNAPIIRSAGRTFPVDIVYGKPKRYDENTVERVVATLVDVIAQHSGNVLVFLPGQAEIHRTLQQLNERLPGHIKQSIEVLPLYGALALRQQQRAIEPITTNQSASTPSIQRKIVLATDIAETSLTIDGISVVVDAGLARSPRFDPTTGMTRLQTHRVSKDASIQRAGRAGRLCAGTCYRLWSKEQQAQLAAHSSPQIVQTDLTALALALLAWGVDDMLELQWLDLPPLGPMSQALDLLNRLGAIERDKQPHNDLSLSPTPRHATVLSGWCISSQGQQMARVPIHPRLSHMLLRGAQQQQLALASTLAALLSEQSPLSRELGADLSHQVAVLTGELTCPKQHQAWFKRIQQQAKTLRQLCQNSSQTKADKSHNTTLSTEDALGFLLSAAYPERIAQRKPGSHHQYLLANGRTAILNETDPLCNAPWLAVADTGASLDRTHQHRTDQHKTGQNDKIFSACAFNPDLLQTLCADLTFTNETLIWGENSDRLQAETIQYVGKIVLSRQPLKTINPRAKRAALINMIKKRGLNILAWQAVTRQWQARVMLLHTLFNDAEGSNWPDVSDTQLLDTLDQWLGPYLSDINKLSDFATLNLQPILENLLPWPLPQRLNELAPTTLKVPSGSQITIDYSGSPPVLNVKLQEMFGCENTPTIAGGRQPLMIHLLSPAKRALQVTQDLASFWRSGYQEVKKQMKGRYPKHPWPDDPLQALPTRKTKRHLQEK